MKMINNPGWERPHIVGGSSSSRWSVSHLVGGSSSSRWSRSQTSPTSPGRESRGQETSPTLWEGAPAPDGRGRRALPPCGRELQLPKIETWRSLPQFEVRRPLPPCGRELQLPRVEVTDLSHLVGGSSSSRRSRPGGLSHSSRTGDLSHNIFRKLANSTGYKPAARLEIAFYIAA